MMNLSRFTANRLRSADRKGRHHRRPVGLKTRWDVLEDRRLLARLMIMDPDPVLYASALARGNPADPSDGESDPDEIPLTPGQSTTESVSARSSRGSVKSSIKADYSATTLLLGGETQTELTASEGTAQSLFALTSSEEGSTGPGVRARVVPTQAGETGLVNLHLVWTYDGPPVADTIFLDAHAFVIVADSATGEPDPSTEAGWDVHEDGPKTRDVAVEIGRDFWISYIFVAFPRTPRTVDAKFSFQLDIQAATADLVVTATHDDEASPTLFGPYIPGTTFPNTFTAEVGGNRAAEVRSIAFRVDGTTWFTEPVMNNKATFSFSMGDHRISTGAQHALVVEARDASGGVVTKFAGTISMVIPDFDLDASYPISTGMSPPIGVEDLRFLNGISLTPKFNATVTGIASYYASKIDGAVMGGVRVAGISGFAYTAATRTASFSYTYDTTALNPGAKAAVRLNLGAASDNLFDVVPLTVLAIPGWIGTPDDSTYSTGADVTDAFGPGVGAYRIDFTRSLDTQALTGVLTTRSTPFHLLDGLKTFARANARLVLFAQPTVSSGTAVVKAEELTFQATVLGQDLQDRTLSKGDFEVKVTLEPRTLTSDGWLEVTAKKFNLIEPANLFNLTVGDPAVSGVKPWIFTVPTTIATNLTLGLKGQLSASVDELSAEAKLRVNVNTGDLDKSNTFLKLNFSGGASASITAKVGIDVLVFKDVITVAATLAGYLQADAQLVLGFDGKISSPVPFVDTNQSSAAIGGSIGANFRITFLGQPAETEIASDPQILPLFGQGPPVPNFANVIEGKLVGVLDAAANKATMGSTSGPSSPFAPLRISPFATTALSLADPADGDALPLAPPEITVLPLADPIHGNVTQVRVTARLLANRAALERGRHTFEAVLVATRDASEVSLGTIDLAELALADDENPLGFASAATLLALPVPGGVPPLGSAYHLEFRLVDDQEGGERVAVELTELAIDSQQPAALLSSPDNDLGTGTVTFLTGAGTMATIRVASTGSQALHVTDVAHSGNGFRVIDPLTPFNTVLYPGESADFRVEVVDPAAGGLGTLTITTDDPAQPIRVLNLIASGVPQDPAPPVNTDPPVDSTPPVDENPPAPPPPLVIDRDPLITPPVAIVAGPRVVGLQRLMQGRAIAGLVLSVDKSLDATSAQQPAPYVLKAAGKDKKFGTRDDKVVRLRDASLDATGTTITLRLRKPLAAKEKYQITVRGADGGLIDRTGRPLGADTASKTGSDFVRVFAVRALGVVGVRRARGK